MRLVRLIVMNVLGELSVLLVCFKLPPYVCMRLITVGIVYSAFRVLDG